MTTFVETISHWHWWILGAALVVLEVLAPGAVFLWMGIAAGAVGFLVLAAPTIGWESQVVAFAVLSVASIFLARRYLKHKPIATDHPNLNRRAQGLIGRVFTLEDPIVDGRSKVQVDDTFWRIMGPDLDAGARVKVVGVVDDVILQVEHD